MTVEQVKKSKRSSKKTFKNSENAIKEDSFSSLDNLVQVLNGIETEEQVSELFEREDLLVESFKSLMKLMGSKAEDENEDDFDTECIDESMMEIMSGFLEKGIIDEEEFEDFFTTDVLDESEVEDDGESEEYSELSEDEEKIKKTDVKQQKSKNLRELKMLMEKVTDESDLDDDEYETEEEEEDEDVSYENDDYENNDKKVSFTKESGKKDIFAEDAELEGGRLSSFEKSQAALAAQITALESENIQTEKPWALRGEINARQRPSDSLLEEAVDFESLSRPVPQITEERTDEIEDIIKRRIEEAAWDDVERKDGRDLTLLNGMSTSNQKSARALLEDVATAGPQRSLAQVYEDDAATKLAGGVTALDEQTAAKQKELTALFAKICRHIDGLSGNRFAPKVYAQSDFQIKTLGSTKKL